MIKFNDSLKIRWAWILCVWLFMKFFLNLHLLHLVWVFSRSLFLKVNNQSFIMESLETVLVHLHLTDFQIKLLVVYKISIICVVPWAVTCGRWCFICFALFLLHSKIGLKVKITWIYIDMLGWIEHFLTPESLESNF
jgi:hypothetical protein